MSVTSMMSLALVHHVCGGCNGSHCHLSFLSMLYFCFPTCVSRSLLSISRFVFFGCVTSSISHFPFFSLFSFCLLSFFLVFVLVNKQVVPFHLQYSSLSFLVTWLVRFGFWPSQLVTQLQTRFRGAGVRSKFLPVNFNTSVQFVFHKISTVTQAAWGRFCTSSITTADMCIYCMDVLVAHRYNNVIRRVSKVEQAESHASIVAR